MEVMLLDGDIALDRQGSPRMVEGDLAVLQRAALRLCVRRGSHPADPQFGSRLHRLRAVLKGLPRGHEHFGTPKSHSRP